MSMDARPLALRFPLRGSRLIEASAGTGKTFTISALYLRLVLGHGGSEAGLGRELLPPEILVVTFTDAATRELRDRIRARLVEAAQAFRGELANADAVLQGLLDDYDAMDWPACARRLDIAAQWMDQAAVSTIHSWCQRMLREHAFDSGSLFTQQLETDHSELLAEVVRDYWRQQCYSLRGPALKWVVGNWRKPDALLARAKVLLGEPASESGHSLRDVIEPVLEDCAAELKQLKAPWPQWLEDLQQFFEQACEAGNFNANKVKPALIHERLRRLRDWCASDSAELSFKDGSSKPGFFKRLTHEGLQDACKKGVVLELSDTIKQALTAMETLELRLAGLPNPAEQALRHAASWILRRFEQEKRRRAEMGFDDMLARLDVALHGANGERLADVIRRQFPVALIDEFQDTDPLQYRIFDRVYRVTDNDPEYGLFLIGDPKQAIYAFRGADIHTYLQAKKATAGRHENLDTNFRSSHSMVQAVNRVFELAEKRPDGRGAFLFADGDERPLPFIEVAAKGRPEVWSVEDQTPPALTAWHLPSEEPLAGGVYQQEMAARCASEMVRLLNLGQQNQAGFVDSSGMRGVRPADMAVLVRGFREAQAIRSELAARGVRSVYLSDKDSVLATGEAADVLRWLRACAEPDNDRLLRAALASATLGLTWTVLDELNQDERIWEQRVFQFRDYRRVWLRQGVLPMLRKIIHDFGLPARLLAESDGERRLTNLLHLAELLQQASRELDGEQALVRHLAELLANPSASASDEQILRLESDAALVKVVTIHKSKGLEYPLVFLPFICGVRPVNKDAPLRLHDGATARLVLEPTEDEVEQADAERLAEDLRLLYVALTRARHACWLGMADIKHGNGKASILHRSAVGQLLSGGQPLMSSAVLPELLAQWAAPGIVEAQPAPDISGECFQPLMGPAPELHARHTQRRAAEHWWIASYSALRPDDRVLQRTRSDDAAPDSPAAQKATDDERHSVFVPLRAGEQATIHRFPRGPGPGTFLHGLLELAGTEGFNRLATASACEQLLRPRCVRRGWEQWVTPLAEWLGGLINRPWPLPGADELRLAGLESGQYQAEMEFLFAANRVDGQQLDELVQRYVLPGQPRAPLAPERLNGLFKGYIDLVCEHESRYYVVDYKSNWLGQDETAYTEAAMQSAVLEHRYDLQFVFYLLALHRQLKARLPGYDYDRHVGGAVYWFVRGGAAENAGIWHCRPPRELIESLDRLFAGESLVLDEVVS
ncbi:exodeoxyribonuclease V subunit beta [Pseudomonas sp. gcc21]|uniref:exodeoxyribonuclease V subunit beta n=1 Tax=Pseudomonas sp. gcc21 TaxID=2726989 RepID=UPI0014529A43|nr:exodeoxyribonuclease V subunit beta [Pseudomonas sp. gcc21]QJD60205.1 exodeoxyribonuclease V subunit beta [Pseudomonas sp. gcc21]